MAERPAYTEVEHTADVGVELVAPDLGTALERTAAAMFDLMSDLDRVEERRRVAVAVRGRDGDLPNLLVRWLSELLFVHESEHLLLCTFAITRLEEGVIEATVGGEPFDRSRHDPKVEIKAATYHELRIEEVGSGWAVRVIFDT